MINSDFSDIANLTLAPEGRKKIEWAGSHMPVLALIKNRLKKEKPFQDIRIGACLHVTSETANLILTLKTGGAIVSLCACNPLSTQDDVAASLVQDFSIPVYAKKGEDEKTYYRHIEKVLGSQPQITLDDGGDLVNSLHSEFKIEKRENKIKIKDSKSHEWDFFGSAEETTTGVLRLNAMSREKALKVPVVAVNASQTKHLFDNRYGTGQSTIDGIMRATNILLAGKTFVVAGYGWCGRGVANRARGMGAKVIVTEVEPVKALEAVMDGYSVMTLKQAAKVGDIFITVTGDKNVISYETISGMKDGAILANSGHFNAEIDVAALEKKAKNKRRIRNFIDEFTLTNGSKRYVLGEGRLINLVAGEGHPAEVMDMSFANQALACEFLVKNQGKLKNKVHTLPLKIDQNVARLKLKAMGVSFDKLTREQKKYLTSWQEGT